MARNPSSRKACVTAADRRAVSAPAKRKPVTIGAQRFAHEVLLKTDLTRGRIDDRAHRVVASWAGPGRRSRIGGYIRVKSVKVCPKPGGACARHAGRDPRRRAGTTFRRRVVARVRMKVHVSSCRPSPTPDSRVPERIERSVDVWTDAQPEVIEIIAVLTMMRRSRRQYALQPETEALRPPTPPVSATIRPAPSKEILLQRAGPECCGVVRCTPGQSTDQHAGRPSAPSPMTSPAAEAIRSAKATSVTSSLRPLRSVSPRRIDQRGRPTEPRATLVTPCATGARSCLK